MAKAVRFHKQGGPEVMQYEDVQVGDPGPGQARIRHTAIGVNFVDVYQRSAPYVIPKKDRPYRPWEKRLFRRFPPARMLP